MAMVGTESSYSDLLSLALLLSIFLFAGGLLLIHSGIKRHLFVQKLKNTPTSKVASAALGIIELSGRARAGLSSPIAKARCAFWRIKAEYYRHGKGAGWRTIYSADSAGQFYLEDDTGKVFVEPRGADLDIPCDKVYEGHMYGKTILGAPRPSLAPEALEYINSLDTAGQAAFMDRKYENIRISEYYISEDDFIYVIGSAEPRPGAATSVGHENIVVKKGRDGIMYLSDSPEHKVVEKYAGPIRWEIAGGLTMLALGFLALFSSSVRLLFTSP